MSVVTKINHTTPFFSSLSLFLLGTVHNNKFLLLEMNTLKGTFSMFRWGGGDDKSRPIIFFPCHLVKLSLIVKPFSEILYFNFSVILIKVLNEEM